MCDAGAARQRLTCQGECREHDPDGEVIATIDRFLELSLT
jgi:hypothetical protein